MKRTWVSLMFSHDQTQSTHSLLEYLRNYAVFFLGANYITLTHFSDANIYEMVKLVSASSSMRKSPSCTLYLISVLGEIFNIMSISLSNLCGPLLATN